MKEHYVSYSQAVKLKELGFEERVNHGYSQKIRIEPELSYGDVKDVHSKDPKNYNDNRKGIAQGIQFFSAPRLDQAAAWVREVKGWHIQVRINGVRSAYWFEIWSTTPNGPVYGTPDDNTFRRGQYEAYEQALSAGIDAALELLTNKQTNKLTNDKSDSNNTRTEPTPYCVWR